MSLQITIVDDESDERENLKEYCKRFLSEKKQQYSLFCFSSAEEYLAAHIRQDIIICMILAPIAIFLPITLIEKLFLFSTLFLIVMAELINTAIEMTIDRISEELHPLSKIAKDIGSCIVLVSFMYLILVWVLILYSNFIAK